MWSAMWTARLAMLTLSVDTTPHKWEDDYQNNKLLMNISLAIALVFTCMMIIEPLPFMYSYSLFQFHRILVCGGADDKYVVSISFSNRTEINHVWYADIIMCRVVGVANANLSASPKIPSNILSSYSWQKIVFTWGLKPIFPKQKWAKILF